MSRFFFVVFNWKLPFCKNDWELNYNWDNLQTIIYLIQSRKFSFWAQLYWSEDMAKLKYINYCKFVNPMSNCFKPKMTYGFECVFVWSGFILWLSLQSKYHVNSYMYTKTTTKKHKICHQVNLWSDVVVRLYTRIYP